VLAVCKCKWQHCRCGCDCARRARSRCTAGVCTVHRFVPSHLFVEYFHCCLDCCGASQLLCSRGCPASEQVRRHELRAVAATAACPWLQPASVPVPCVEHGSPKMDWVGAEQLATGCSGASAAEREHDGGADGGFGRLLVTLRSSISWELSIAQAHRRRLAHRVWPRQRQRARLGRAPLVVTEGQEAGRAMRGRERSVMEGRRAWRGGLISTASAPSTPPAREKGARPPTRRAMPAQASQASSVAWHSFLTLGRTMTAFLVPCYSYIRGAGIR